MHYNFLLFTFVSDKSVVSGFFNDMNVNGEGRSMSAPAGFPLAGGGSQNIVAPEQHVIINDKSGGGSKEVRPQQKVSLS